MTLEQNWNLMRLAAAHPRLSVCRFQRRFLREFPRKVKRFPVLLNFFLFSGCNLRCSMCGQWRRKTSQGSSGSDHYLPLGKLKKIADQAAGFSPEIYIWGGEPTLHPDFAEFAGYLKSRGFVVTVNTNGTRLRELAGAVAATGVDSLDISLDGPAEVHDAIRGVKGTYARVMEGLRELEKSKPHPRRPLVKAVITLSPGNLGSVECLLRELEGNPGIHMSIVQLGWFTPAAAGLAYERQLREGFGAAGGSWRGFEDNAAHERARECRELLERIRKGSYRKPILFFPDLPPRQVERYYRDHADPLKSRGCRAFYNEAQIMPNGDVVICMDYPDLVVGNVWQETMEEIWSGERLRKFRTYQEQKGRFAICTRCCGFFK